MDNSCSESHAWCRVFSTSFPLVGHFLLISQLHLIHLLLPICYSIHRQAWLTLTFPVWLRIQDFPAHVDLACFHVFVLVKTEAFSNWSTLFLSVSCSLACHHVADKLVWGSKLDCSAIGNLLAILLSFGCLPCSQPGCCQQLEIPLLKVTSKFPFLVHLGPIRTHYTWSWTWSNSMLTKEAT